MYDLISFLKLDFIENTSFFRIAWAAENKLTNGVTETTFVPNQAISRQQFLTILYRYAVAMQYDVTVKNADEVLLIIPMRRMSVRMLFPLCSGLSAPVSLVLLMACWLLPIPLPVIRLLSSWLTSARR